MFNSKKLSAIAGIMALLVALLATTSPDAGPAMDPNGVGRQASDIKTLGLHSHLKP